MAALAHRRRLAGAYGQSMVEYALIFALIVIVVFGTLLLLGPQIASAYHNIENAI
jgi:Flp pilus assembly pilin Flp